MHDFHNFELVHPLVQRQVHQRNDQNIGSNRGGSASLSGLISTVVPVFVIAFAMTLAFMVLRRTQVRQYAPRTYLGSLRKQERTPALPNSFFGWIPEFNKLPDTYVLQHNSLDGYFLLRFLKIATIICFVGCCITWPILFPVNATGHGGQQQLNILSFSNVKDKNRYYAHTFVAWIYIAFIFFMVTRESIYYINLRQAYLLSPLYASRISSRTVLFTSVPTAYMTEAKIRKIFGQKVRNLWLATDCKKLEKKVEERDKIAMKLEAAETKLIKLSNAARLKSSKGNADHEEAAVGADAGAESGSAAARYIQPKQRPTHRLTFLVGKKVDTINWSRSELSRLIPEIKEEQSAHQSGDVEPLNAVMVEFYNQTEAQAAYQMLTHHQPLHMTPRVVGFSPDEVVWSNLGITWKSRTLRNIASIAAVVVTIIFWSIPVAVVGAISNITYLTKVAPFLSFINKCPTVILGVITNLLPTIMLAVLMSLLPIYLRFLAKFAGIPTLSYIELRLQTSFFWFQVIQVFLVTTMTSAASAAVPQIIKNPGSLTTTLAENIPLASNFYISYFILQGLTFTSGALLQIVGLITYKVLGRILGSTPRKMYQQWSTLSSIGWGTVFPVLTLLLVISITYSTIAPLMLGFSTIGLYFFYFAFRYNLLFVNSSDIDTKGLVYPKALQHTLVGCYLSIICMIGLFGIRAAVGPLILMIIFGIFCVLYHITLNSALSPLFCYLPRSLEAEEDALLGAEEGHMDKVPESDEGAKMGSSSAEPINSTSGPSNGQHPLGPPPHGKPSWFQKFFRPDIYADYATCRRLVPHDFAEIRYSPEIEKKAYYNPAVTKQVPLLWVPRDAGGVSRQEVAHTSRVTPMTDESAGFDEKGKLDWDMEGTEGRPPVHEEKIYY